MKTVVAVLAAIACAMCLSGCGGGGADQTQVAGREFRYGILTTRAVGAIQEPVTAAGTGAVVTGQAGGVFTAIETNVPDPDPADSLIAFVSNRTGQASIFSMGPNGESVAPIVIGNTASGPVWSPDGSVLAYYQRSDTTGDWTVYFRTEDGNISPAWFTSSTTVDGCPSWSPSGAEVAFQRSVAGGNYQIWRASADGTGTPAQVTNETVGHAVAPAWAPDGFTVLYAWVESAGNSQIVSIRTDGTQRTLYEKTPLATKDEYPTWSPDGRHIAYQSNADGVQGIWIMDADGRNRLRLTPNNMACWRPAWSPDGLEVVFHANAAHGQSQIYRIGVDGTGLTRMTTTSASVEDSQPCWGVLRRRHLIGAHGSMGTTAAGFLFGQRGKSMASIVTFNATTPGNVRLVSQTGISPTVPNCVFTLSATDSLTALDYMNGTSLRPTSALADGANGAIVSFDAADGAVGAIVPYAATREGSGAPKVTAEDGRIVIRGRLLGAWDRAGRNTAPNGAAEVRIDASGRALSLR